MIDNPFEMVVLIVLITAVAGVLRGKYGRGRRAEGAVEAPDSAETQRLREDVRALKDRVAVLERIATDKNHLLEQEFERLRER